MYRAAARHRRELRRRRHCARKPHCQRERRRRERIVRANKTIVDPLAGPARARVPPENAFFSCQTPRPASMAMFFDGQEKNGASHGFAGADEVLALFVGTDAQNGERPVLRHSTPPWSEVSRARIIQRPPARDTEIAETDQRAAPRLLRCAPRLRRARSASRSRASSLF